MIFVLMVCWDLWENPLEFWILSILLFCLQHTKYLLYSPIEKWNNFRVKTVISILQTTRVAEISACLIWVPDSFWFSPVALRIWHLCEINKSLMRNQILQYWCLICFPSPCLLTPHSFPVIFAFSSTSEWPLAKSMKHWKLKKHINLRLVAFTRAIFNVVEDIQLPYTLSLLVQSPGTVKSITCLATHTHRRKPVTAD